MIKLFEEYNQYYTEISFDDFCKFDTHVDSILFHTNDYIALTDQVLSVTKKIKEIAGQKNYDTKICIKSIRLLKDNKKVPHFKNMVEIYGTEDEWYYIILTKFFINAREEQYYKCDQEDGLLKCLNKIL